MSANRSSSLSPGEKIALVAGTACAAVAIAVGLAVLGAFVLMVVGLNNWGSNK
jgi:hypothetical protein